MRTKYRLLLAILGLIILMEIIFNLVVYLHGHTVAVLSPQGTIAAKERNLLTFAVILSMFVVLPVFALTFWIAWRYRASRPVAKYAPNWDGSRKLEAIWWGIPICIIFILGVVTWRSSHALDPFKPLSSNKPALNIQVVSLQWKWLFIYPDQRIATVNYFRVPVDTPIHFELTSDAPMNSFWVPQLGGQIYTMTGMSTQLSLQATHVGRYNGSSANISGEGFAGMKFIAEATSQQDFDTWVNSVKTNQTQLSQAAYQQLAAPSKNNPVATYGSVEPDLYSTIVMKYMGPDTQAPGNGHMQMGSK